MRVRTTDDIIRDITEVFVKAFEWHPATLVQRKKGGNWQVQITVPQWARDAFGRNQHRKSAGTSDKRIAEARQHDIEDQMRKDIMRKYESSTLWERNSPYRKAVETLGLEETFYRGEWVDDVTDVVEIPLSQPPKDDEEKQQAFEAIYNAARRVQANAELLACRLRSLGVVCTQTLCAIQLTALPCWRRKGAILFHISG